MSVQVSCPGCGAAITFKVGSAMVAVCPYCRSVVARGDRHVENLGKVADLADTGSPLEIGLKGTYQGVPFELTGRAQLSHPAGGVWDEWYAAFADGRWGWLAEAQGRFYLTFQQPPRPFSAVPPFAKLELGKSLQINPTLPELVIADKGLAQAASAQGEIPWRLVPNESYPYADLSGPDAEFATLDYSATPPLVFFGREIQLGALGISPKDLAREPEAHRVEGVQLSCPDCGAALELRAPGKTLRVTCPSCCSLLDVREGQLSFFKALAPGKIKPIIPLGTVGKFEGHPFTVIGFLKRSVPGDHTRYSWEEYLLYHPHLGFRWLVQSDNHWSYVQPLPPGRVHAYARSAKFENKEFKLFQKDRARVDYVLGEFYWLVEIGEQVMTTDYIRPPEMLSREASVEEEASEINWSLGTYWRPQEVEKSLGLEGLPRPDFMNIAPNQPFRHKRVYQYWGLLTAAVFVIGPILFAAVPRNAIYQRSVVLQPAAKVQTSPGLAAPTRVGAPQRIPAPAANVPQSQVSFSEPFELTGHRNVRVTAVAPGIDNNWVDIEGDFINEKTNLVQSFSVPISYYHGTSGGESWSEGSPKSAAHISALPAGKYRLRLELFWQNRPGFPWSQGKLPANVNVVVEQGVPRLLHWFLAMLALAAFPVVVLIYHYYFAKKRWENSPYSPFHSK